MFLLFAIATFASATETGTLACKAIFRNTEKNGRSIENVVNMPLTYAKGGLFKYEADLEGRFFSLMEEKTNSLLGQITQGPDYTKGVVSRGTTDSSGRFNVADVDGFTVYKIECRKL